MKERVVLDSSAFFAMEDMSGDWEAYTSPGVLRELQRYNDGRAAYLEHKVKVSDPTSNSLERVAKAAKETGDASRLSAVDREVLALAIDLEAVLLTDDYSMQNLAKHIGLPYRAVGLKPIQKKVVWSYRCTGCGKVIKEQQPDCPVCGSALRTTRKR
ncbi:MAG: nucleic acid-binding protein [Methanomassiliicoccales archaeon]|nr:nucleic acid-binding protein [Methanomassiliicoccales archaeon]